MDNITYARDGNKLIITVTDLTVPGVLSGSGKSHIIAGTGGFVAVDGAGVSFAVNVIRPKAKSGK